ncbi:MAG: hypothetical protein ACYC27_19455 [Armatimonadota bacterium]
MKCFFIILAVLLASISAFADGEPTRFVSGTGILVPTDSMHTQVLDQRITITLPKAFERKSDNITYKALGRAVIRAEYILHIPKDYGVYEPLRMDIGWLVADPFKIRTNNGKIDHVSTAIKFDGKSVAWNYIEYKQLTEPYTRNWLKQIDKLLESKPALKERVMAIRKEGESQETYWRETAGAGKLQNWMMENGFEIENKHDKEIIARGLLGWESKYNYSIGYDIQKALAWLDPSYEPVELNDVLSQRWSHSTLLLDPDTDLLIDVRDSLNQWWDFSLFRFPITIEPGKKHKLTVQYTQSMGRVDDWYGIVYLMEPARKWGRWEKTTIDIRVPNDWNMVAIRPKASIIETANGYTTHRISINGRPYENLFISGILKK